MFEPDYLPITRRHRANRLDPRTYVISIAIRDMYGQGRWTTGFKGACGPLLVDQITDRSVGDRHCVRLNQRP
ncbi:MAG: hypothetical protein CMD56_08955 [Gammaproteobacteria bacterium]|nr:hypothetical protein [Gammaproteobacteria bacterium]